MLGTRPTLTMKKLGKYELSENSAKAPTSTVYLGWDPFAQRNVAIKVATPEVLRWTPKGKLYTSLFLNEACWSANSITHISFKFYDAVVAENLLHRHGIRLRAAR